jgi:hypothetical protein
MPKILGRDPVLWMTAVAAVVQFISAFVVHVSVEAQGAIAGVTLAVLGLIGAAMLHDGTWAAAVVALFKAAIAAGLAFGLAWSPEQQAEMMFFVQAVLSLLVRQQVVAPVDASGGRIGARPL